MNTTTAIRPFRIDVPQAELDRLNRRLDDTRLPQPLPGDGWDTGVPVGWLREIVGYWRNSYN
jgi:epoxide hydrolase